MHRDNFTFFSLMFEYYLVHCLSDKLSKAWLMDSQVEGIRSDGVNGGPGPFPFFTLVIVLHGYTHPGMFSREGVSPLLNFS